MTDLVTTPRDKAFVSMLDITQYTGRAMFTTPDVPGERLEALRAAFDATMADPAFVAEMTIQKRDGVMPQLKALLNLD